MSTIAIKTNVVNNFSLLPAFIQALDKAGGAGLPEGSPLLTVMPRTESGDIDVSALNNISTLLKENTTITNC